MPSLKKILCCGSHVPDGSLPPSRSHKNIVSKADLPSSDLVSPVMESSGAKFVSEVVDDRFCDTCRVFKLNTTTKDYLRQHPELKGHRRWYGPHTRIVDLAESAASGCSFCRILHEAVTVVKQHDPRGKVWKPTNLYRVFDECRPNDAFFGCEKLTDFQLFIPQPKAHDTTYKSEVIGAMKPRYVGIEAIPVKPELVARLDDETCFDLARMWSASCEKSHPQCRLESALPLPKRVIDVGFWAEDPIRLHLTTLRETFDYVALSHCWGDADTVPKTMIKDLKHYQRRIPKAFLSRTFQDAIKITRQLGFRYIWIDALCIIQDSEDDWKEQAAAMANVYGGAFVTIAATSASNGAGGCFTCRQSSDFRLGSAADIGYDVYARPVDGHRDNFPSALRERNSEPKWPVMKRKWCFQERMLSRRMLCYTDKELVWECKTELRCQCDGRLAHGTCVGPHLGSHKAGFARLSNVPGPTGLSLYHNDTNAIRLWEGVLEEYTARQLTYPEDILPAFSGVARAFDGRGWGIYCAGIWSNLLPASLYWRSTTYVSHHRSSEYLAPSWSWASIVGAVETPWLHLYIDPLECDAVVCSASCICSSSDPFGRVEGGKLVLDAAACQRKVMASESGIDCSSEHWVLSERYCFFENEDRSKRCHIDTEEDFIDVLGASVWLLCIRQSLSSRDDGFYLILRANADGTYRRIGMSAFQRYHSVESSPRRRFEII